MADRTFSPGDPALPTSGILVGSGGGFTQIYDDYVLLADGQIKKIHYMTSDGPIPPDFTVTGTAKVDAQIISGFQAKLVQIGFWDLQIAPPLSDTFHYLVAVEPRRAMHFVLWGPKAPDGIATLKALYDEIVKFADRAVKPGP